ncbi:DUF3853 family protein [Porphyromonas canoris]|uniref:DUF3853 family protein n=1 Tax=Porphyromonas canoris TaxID=36875 RepID=UPI00068A03C0|nr:DUF3853 family protein [Porphyromonas canoris]
MILEELLGKPVWQMTGEELLFLARHGSQPSNTNTEEKTSKEQNTMCMIMISLESLIFQL